MRDAFVSFRRTEFRRQIFLPRNAFARNPVIQEIGPVVHLDRDFRIERNGFLEPALAYETPRTNHVGDDIDTNWLAAGHGWLPSEASLGRWSLRCNHAAAQHAHHQGVEGVAGLERCQSYIGDERFAATLWRVQRGLERTSQTPGDDMGRAQVGLREC